MKNTLILTSVANATWHIQISTIHTLHNNHVQLGLRDTVF